MNGSNLVADQRVQTIGGTRQVLHVNELRLR
jgi:hypothetical protein